MMNLLRSLIVNALKVSAYIAGTYLFISGVVFFFPAALPLTAAEIALAGGLGGASLWALRETMKEYAHKKAKEEAELNQYNHVVGDNSSSHSAGRDVNDNSITTSLKDSDITVIINNLGDEDDNITPASKQDVADLLDKQKIGKDHAEANIEKAAKINPDSPKFKELSGVQQQFIMQSVAEALKYCGVSNPEGLDEKEMFQEVKKAWKAIEEKRKAAKAAGQLPGSPTIGNTENQQHVELEQHTPSSGGGSPSTS